jgi:hypothetical protein
MRSHASVVILFTLVQNYDGDLISVIATIWFLLYVPYSFHLIVAKKSGFRIAWLQTDLNRTKYRDAVLTVSEKMQFHKLLWVSVSWTVLLWNIVLNSNSFRLNLNLGSLLHTLKFSSASKPQFASRNESRSIFILRLRLQKMIGMALMTCPWMWSYKKDEQAYIMIICEVQLIWTLHA